MPALTVSDEEIDQLIDILDRVLKDVALSSARYR
jgi:4-aminobutyrate aminotransferase-like enzyme